MISMVPSPIFFAAFGAKPMWGKKGSKKGIVTWTCISMAITVLILFFIFTDTVRLAMAAGT
ncbi:MAG: hypothetical protein ACLVJH_02425 [Faecalibacterium prausnitzii]